MALLTITASEVDPVIVWEQLTGPCGEAFDAGQYTRIDATTGYRALGNASAAGEVGDFGGICLKSGNINGQVTVIRKGILNVGNALSALAYGADVFLSDTDGTLADTAGTVSTIVGKVIPGYGNVTPDKLLYVNIEW